MTAKHESEVPDDVVESTEATPVDATLRLAEAIEHLTEAITAAVSRLAAAQPRPSAPDHGGTRSGRSEPPGQKGKKSQSQSARKDSTARRGKSGRTTDESYLPDEWRDWRGGDC